MMKAFAYFIAGAVFILFGIISSLKSKAKLTRCNTPISGQIARINEEIEESDTGHKKKISYVPVFQYSINGKIYEKSSNISSYNKSEYKIGDSAEILYNPSKPDEFVIKGKSAKSEKGFAVVMLLIGIALIVVGITQI